MTMPHTLPIAQRENDEPIGPSGFAGYQLRLPAFEGPFDVLLRLIEREHVAITDVSLVAVTDQFLLHLAALEGASAATIAEFAAIAGRLVLLKSRSLFPRPAVAEEAEPLDLVRQLAEYRVLRNAADRLRMVDLDSNRSFARGGGVVVPEAPLPRLARHQASALSRALRRRLTTTPPPPTTIGLRPVVTLREMAERLLTQLGRSPAGRLGFKDFWVEGGDRAEVMVGFLAVLSLVRGRVLRVEQETLFGEIRLRWESGAMAGTDPAAFPVAADD